MEVKESGGANTFAALRTVDVGKYIEKKNGLSYLSWAWAVDQLLQHCPTATWEYRFGKDGGGNEVPFVYVGDTAMVFCTVHAFGVSRTAQLPVMDHRNRPIPNPDSFQVNTAMQRALAKAIALHGLGLYIYSGEDIPPDADEAKPEPKPVPEPKVSAKEVVAGRAKLDECISVEGLRKTYETLDPEVKKALREYAQAKAKGLE